MEAPDLFFFFFFFFYLFTVVKAGSMSPMDQSGESMWTRTELSKSHGLGGKGDGMEAAEG